MVTKNIFDLHKDQLSTHIFCIKRQKMIKSKLKNKF